MEEEKGGPATSSLLQGPLPRKGSFLTGSGWSLAPGEAEVAESTSLQSRA